MPVSRSVRRRLFAASPTCAYCGSPLSDLNRRRATIDHVVPVSRGGESRESNLIVACGTCNRCKSNRTPTEWAADILAVAGLAVTP